LGVGLKRIRILGFKIKELTFVIHDIESTVRF